MNASSDRFSLTSAFSQAATQDFDDQAALLEGWNQCYTQLSSGAFKGHITQLRLENMHLFAESTSHALFQSGKLDDDQIAIGIPLQSFYQGVFCGTAMNVNSAHVFSGENGFEFYSPAQLTMGGLVIAKTDLLSRVPEKLHDAILKNTAQPHLLPTAPTVLNDAREFLSHIFLLCQKSPALLESPNFKRQLHEAVMACAADILTDCVDEPQLSSQRRWEIVKHAREFLAHSPDSNMTVESLCLRLGVSRRTLQYCFQELLGISPVAFLRAQRLNGVRHMLKEVSSVTEAATTWGFWHFGHFSQEYKKLFGEKPSETLRRLH